MKKWLTLLTTIALFSACSEQDCSQVEQELLQVRSDLANRDSIIDAIGFTFQAIDSNLLNMRTIEGELAKQMSATHRDKPAIRANVEKLREIMAMNQAYIDRLESNLQARSSNSANLFSIIGSMEEKVTTNNLRLARLNHDLGTMGEDFKNMFDEYMQAEVNRMVLEENLQSMEGNLSDMEARMKELNTHLNTAYVAIGTRRELINSGVLEKGGLLKTGGVNEDADQKAFEARDVRDLDVIDVGSDRAKLVTEHPSESYKIKDGKLVITAPEAFWSISKYLIVVTD